MWSVEYQVTTPSTISIVAMATSAVSSAAAASSAAASSAAASSSATSSRCQCVGRAPGMLLEDVFELCRKSKEDILRWLLQELIIGDGLDVVTATRSWYLGFNFRVLG